jgi:hypothetical protein
MRPDSNEPAPMTLDEPLLPVPAAEPGRCLACPDQRRPGRTTCLLCELKGIRDALRRDHPEYLNLHEVQTETRRAIADLDALIRDLEASR